MDSSWDDARTLDALCYDLVLGDYPRGLNRSRIADLANGVPPYTAEEVQRNNIVVNVNGLALTRALHGARGQFYNGFLRPGKYFTCRTDYGPQHKRDKYGTIVTNEINKVLKKSVSYFESMRAKFALLMLHGISPAVWTNQDGWCPKPLGVDDILMPSGTELGFHNLPFFVIRRSFTGPELRKLAKSPIADPGWNPTLVDACLKWIDEQTTKLMGTQYPEVWAPEKLSEDIKEMQTWAYIDQAPKITCFDIYAWNDEEGEEGWIRRIILDAWSTPQSTGIPTEVSLDRKTEGPKGRDKSAKEDFLYTSSERKVAQSWQQIISFQFADLTAVAPFRYHNVRSLGFLLYAPCHLQNRMECKFNEAVFEALMMYFKVKSQEDVQRALKLQLVNRGFIDESLMPLTAGERYQVNTNLVELGMQQNQSKISESAGAFSQRRDFSRDRSEKTRYQVMAELNGDTALVGSAVEQAFQYHSFEDAEIVRRFMNRDSNDPDVKRVQAAILRQDVPEDFLDISKWEVDHERVMGAGNKTIEMQIADWLMSNREKYDPDGQRKVLRHSTMLFTGDSRFTDDLVPEQPVKLSDSMHDAQLVTPRLLQGLPTAPTPHANQQEVAGSVLADLNLLVNQYKQQGGMAPTDKLEGMQRMIQYIQECIKILSTNPESKQLVTALEKALAGPTNEIRAMGQRLQAAAQKQAQSNGNGQADPQTIAKVKGAAMVAQQKIQQTKDSHAQKTAQRQITFEQQTKQKAEEHRMEMAKEGAQFAIELHKNRMASMSDDE